MPKDSKEKAIAEAKRAQLDYERNVDAAREARRKSFERAQKAGLPTPPNSAELLGRDSLYRARFGSIDGLRLDS